MRRRLGAVAVAVLVALVGAGCSDDGDSGGAGAGAGDDGKSSVEQGRELTTVQAGKLTVCTKVPQAPFEYEDGSDLKGIDIDLMKAVTGRLGLAVDFRRGSDPIGAMKAGRCDLVASAVAVSDELKAVVDFSAAYFDVRQAIVVRKGDEGRYKDFASLAGKPVAFPRTPAALVYLTDHAGEVAGREVATEAEAVQAVIEGKTEAAVVDHPIALFSAHSGAGTALGAVLNEGEEPMEQYALALPKDKPALKSAVENALAQVRSDDSYRTILTNYLGSTAGQA